jgi:aspartate-semialdehyde dehydrogenase
MDAATGRELRIAVVGATGAVGEQIVELIDARALPCAELALFATERGATQTVEALGEALIVAEFHDAAELSRFDIAFLAVAPSWAAEIIRARPGPLLVDLSAAVRAPAEVPSIPLVAPGFTPAERIAEIAASDRVVAIPHPAAHALATIVNAAGAQNGIVCATVMLGASSAGRHGVEDVVREATELLSGTHNPEEGEIRRAFNAYPVDAASGPPAGLAAGLAPALAAQTTALLGAAPRLVLEVIHLPVLHGSAMTVLIPDPPDPDNLAARLRAAPGLLLVADDEGSAGVVDAVGHEAILVRLRTQPAGASIWCAFDSARLAALDAVWVAEKLSGIASPGLA